MSSRSEKVAIATAAIHAGSAAATAGMDLKNSAPEKPARPEPVSPAAKNSRDKKRG